MKRTSAAVAVAVMGFAALTACAGTSATPTVTVTREVPAEPVQPITPPQETLSDEEQYLDYIRSKEPDFYGVDDATSIETGQTVCEALDQGLSLDILVMMAADAGLSAEGGAALIAGAVMFLCPEHTGTVKAQL